MTILVHVQGKNIVHYSTGLCIKKFSIIIIIIIIMWICHAVKTTKWFCGGGAQVMYEQLTESMPSIVQLSQSRSAYYRLSYNASKLVVTLAD
jgi:hypothetical protein